MLVMHTITPTTVPATIPPTPGEESPLPACLPLALLTSVGMDGAVAGLLGMSLVDLMPDIILVDIMLIAVTVVAPVDIKVVDVAAVTMVDDAPVDVAATSIDIVLIDFTLVGVLIADVISVLLDDISLDVILVDVTDITSNVITDCDGNIDVVDDDDIVVDIRETSVGQSRSLKIMMAINRIQLNFFNLHMHVYSIN